MCVKIDSVYIYNINMLTCVEYLMSCPLIFIGGGGGKVLLRK